MAAIPMAPLRIELVDDVVVFEYSFSPWMTAIELLAQISNQTTELTQKEVNGLGILILDELEDIRSSHGLLLGLWCNCTGRHSVKTFVYELNVESKRVQKTRGNALYHRYISPITLRV